MSAPAAIEQLANAVLYEGFLLYPYRLSSVKNRHRWNFGVLYPEPFARARAERSAARTECLLQAGGDTAVEVKVRFLQLTDGAPVEREILSAAAPLDELVHPRREGPLEVSATKIGAGLYQIAAVISNSAAYEGADRDDALALAMISTHVIFSAHDGQFVSLIDPPPEFQEAVAQCRNEGLWPVLAGRDGRQVLSAPIILYDNPRIAPHSPGDLFDGTEIDEILTLRIRTLTDGEKAEMRATDDRARALLDRSEALTREELSRLHAPMHREGASFKKGDRVRLRPRRRADIFDIALAGRAATIVSVEHDLEDGIHLCVTVDDDPGRDLGAEGKPGHRFFFSTDEVEPV